MKKFKIFAGLLLLSSCTHTRNEALALIQIQDRNGLTETISNPDRLTNYQQADFLASQPYQKVFRVFKNEEGKNTSKITTYHPNGMLFQYLEAEEMRAHGAYREWFANGQQKVEATVIGGTADLSEGGQSDWLFDSLSKVWDEQGNLIALIPYNKGVLDGKSLYYYPTNVLERELAFEKGYLNGISTEYAPDGSLRQKTHYKNGIKDGECLIFFKENSLASIEEYSEGRLVDGKYYDLEGNFISQVEKGGGFQAVFENGELTLVEHRIGLPEGLVKKFNAAGEILRSFSMKNGMKNAEQIDYFLPSETQTQEPLPKLSISWKENAIHGCVKTWYSNAQLQSQRDYSYNIRSGPSLAWYRDGSLMLYEEYENGDLVSGQYYKIRKKEPVSSVIAGAGIATLYDESGSFLKKVNYLNGKPLLPEE